MKSFCKIVIVVTQIVALNLLMVGCAPFSSASGIDVSPASTTLPYGLPANAEQLSPTIYFIKLMQLDQQECDSKKTIYDENQSPIIKVCEKIYRNCVIEGTCALIENQSALIGINFDSVNHKISLINYVKMKNGIPLFIRVDTQRCPYGYGVKSQCLDPFYTLAADLNFHKSGDVIYIPKVVGTKLPNGEIHNGYFIVRDKGGAIVGKSRFDFFTGFLDYRDSENPFSKIKLNDKNVKFQFRKVTGAEADTVRKNRNFPLAPGSQ